MCIWKKYELSLTRVDCIQVLHDIIQLLLWVPSWTWDDHEDWLIYWWAKHRTGCSWQLGCLKFCDVQQTWVLGYAKWKIIFFGKYYIHWRGCVSELNICIIIWYWVSSLASFCVCSTSKFVVLRMGFLHFLEARCLLSVQISLLFFALPFMNSI